MAMLLRIQVCKGSHPSSVVVQKPSINEAEAIGDIDEEFRDIIRELHGRPNDHNQDIRELMRLRGLQFYNGVSFSCATSINESCREFNMFRRVLLDDDISELRQLSKSRMAIRLRGILFCAGAKFYDNFLEEIRGKKCQL